MNSAVVFENDLGNVAGGSLLTSGSGGIAARSASAAALAVAIFAQLDDHPLLESYDLSKLRGGNGYVWAQNRGGSNGHDGSNFLCLSTVGASTGRWHSHTRSTVIPKGWLSNTRYLVTDSWTNCKTKMQQLSALTLL
jgi:hypothetical protein